ncbi:hypothetical protein RRG08_011255 [Elysia crispata]|uniref:Uncharacterized protein n=1 Tax=Elysia crispata TaxID=231223 RepID=A0AAE0YPJ8_9GAST|nr:hypothetical protein RRG08_011255 [Elysia crispata]
MWGELQVDGLYQLSACISQDRRTTQQGPTAFISCRSLRSVWGVWCDVTSYQDLGQLLNPASNSAVHCLHAVPLPHRHLWPD